ncbi:hypothetical protein Efla_006982 [Eimeria flavescens]
MEGTDPADKTPDSAAGKDAICIVLQEDTVNLEFMGKTKKKKIKGYGMCEGILTLGPTPERSDTKLEAWLGGEGLRCPAAIRKVVCSYKHLFWDKLPSGLPPRVVDHATFVPGQMPRKGAVYRLGGEELEAQRRSLQELKENKGVSLTSSPYAASSMMVSGKDDDSGQR